MSFDWAEASRTGIKDKDDFAAVLREALAQTHLPPPMKISEDGTRHIWTFDQMGAETVQRIIDADLADWIEPSAARGDSQSAGAVEGE